MTNSLYGESGTIAKSVLLLSPCVIANPGSVCLGGGGGGGGGGGQSTVQAR